MSGLFFLYLNLSGCKHSVHDILSRIVTSESPDALAGSQFSPLINVRKDPLQRNRSCFRVSHFAVGVRVCYNVRRKESEGTRSTALYCPCDRDPDMLQCSMECGVGCPCTRRGHVRTIAVLSGLVLAGTDGGPIPVRVKIIIRRGARSGRAAQLDSSSSSHITLRAEAGLSFSFVSVS